MKKWMIGIGLMGWILGSGLHSMAFAQDSQKSIGTEAGEKARDAKDQLEATSKKLDASFQEMMARMQEEWRKFLEAFNKPKT